MPGNPGASVRQLWTRGNGKTRKSVAQGYHTAILHLAPAFSALVRSAAGVLLTVCAYAGACRFPCLNISGRVEMEETKRSTILRARRARTRFYWRDTAGFLARLKHEARAEIRFAERRGLIPTFRPNGTSDRPDIAHALCDAFPTRQFYDYTKLPKPWLRVRPNYHLTFSRDSDANWQDCLDALAHGINVSVSFRVCSHRRTCKCALPQTWRGLKVIDGDEHDLRFLDPVGVVVGLRAKGKRGRSRRAIREGFTVDVRGTV